jgi:hypothetical protein
LGVAAAAIHRGHELGKRRWVAHPFTGAAFVEAAEVDELHVEPADAGGFGKHFGLD